MSQPLSDLRFLAIRSLIVELGAALDRAERQAGTRAALDADPRWSLVRQAVDRLASGQERAEAIQLLFSDTYDPAWRATGGPTLAGSRGCCGE